ncbi:MAG: hypothetical protein HRU02_02140 [Myxococcales bacterium]|nr:hypothetical protein [Myxococcales bacterium]
MGSAATYSPLSPWLGCLLALVACSVEDVPSGQGGGGSQDVSAIETQIMEILRDTDGLERISKLSAYLLELPPEQAKPVARAFESSFLDRGDIELVIVAEWWGRFDPEAALDWTAEYWKADHPRVESAVFRALARHDAKRAVEVVLSRPFANEPIAKSDAYDAVIVGWFDSGQPGLLEFVVSISGLEASQRALRSLARLHVARDGPEAALSWSENADVEEGIRKIMASRVLAATALVDPQLAATWAQRDGPERFGPRLYPRVAMTWVQEDAEATLEWIRQLPADRERDEAVRTAFRIWHRRHPEDASRWLEEQGDEPWLDMAVITLVRAESRSDRSASSDIWQRRAEKLSSITDDHSRWSEVAWAVHSWAAKDPQAAAYWLDSYSELPDTYRSKLMDLLSPLIEDENGGS